MLSLRSVVETGHPRIDGNLCDPSEAIIVNGNSGSDFIFWQGGLGISGEVAVQFPSKTPNITKNTIPGSSIQWRWDNNTLARSNVSDYSALIITHASSMNVGWDTNGRNSFLNSCDTWVGHYWQNANSGNGGGKVWFAGTQPRLDRPDYIGNCRFRHEMWSKAQDQSNIKRPDNCPRVQIIPAYLAYQKIYEDQSNAVTPSSTFFDDLYIDAFHQSDTGCYIHLVMHMACIFGVDPLDVTPQPVGLNITLQESEYIRQVCYDVMHWTERHGVNVSLWD